MSKGKRAECAECPAYHDPCLWEGGGDNPAHLVIIGDAPSGFSIGKGEPFYGNNGRLFKELLKMVRQMSGGKYKDIKVYYAYAALVGSYDPTAAHLSHCQQHLIRAINYVQGIKGRNPILVPLGPLAIKALGITANITDVVGRELTVPLKSSRARGGIGQFKVVPLLGMKHLRKEPGTASVEMSALLAAARLAYDEPSELRSLDELAKNYVFPSTIAEVSDIVDHVLDYYQEASGKGPEHWTISIDTETNTLYPYWHPDPKVLMVSCAWDVGKATTILLDHPETPYDPKEAWRYVKRLLQCPKPKVFHNWKFDKKFLEFVYDIPVTHIAWDTLLGEHFLDEDKKGLYSLKQLTPLYAREYQGYDEELDEILRGKEKVSVGGDNTGEVLYLSNAKVFEENTIRGCPQGRDETLWKKLIEILLTKKTVQTIVPKERSSEEKKLFAQLGRQAKGIRETLRILTPKKQKKGEEKKKVSGFEEIPLEIILRYAAVDADVTRLILKGQVKRLHRTKLWEEGLSVTNELYLPGSNTLSAMEHRGFAVDVPYLDRTEEEVRKRLEAAQSVIHGKLNTTINLNSPQQVSKLMVHMGFDTISGSESGSTAKDILASYEKMYSEGDPRHLLATKLQEYREASTAHKFLKSYQKLTGNDGRIHCNLNLQTTSTGRLSSSGPNLQNIPHIMGRRTKKNPKTGERTILHPGHNIKKIFVAANPIDNLLANVDISGAELRVYTGYSHDELMIKALQEGVDIHSLVTSKIHKIPYEEIVEKKETNPDIERWRTECKSALFAIFYGGGPYKIAQIIDRPLEVAKELHRSIFNEFPAIRLYVAETTTRIQQEQMLQTFFGRCRRFRLARVSNEHFAEAVREGVNFLIQSTSSDLVLAQMCEIDQHIEELGAKLLITVHDSFVLELPRKLLDLETITVDGKKRTINHNPKLHDFLDHWIVRRIEEKYTWLPVPFKYDITVGESYGEQKPIERAEAS